MDWCKEEQTTEPGRALPHAVAKEGGGVHLQQRRLPEHELQSEYVWLPRGAPSLSDYYHFMKSIKDQTNVGYDVIVAEFVNK